LSFKLNNILKQALFVAPVLVMILFTCCEKRPEDELFDLDENFEFYQWENHSGPKIFESPENFTLPASEIHQFTISSTDPKTLNQVKIKAALFGDPGSLAQDSLIVFCHGGQYHMDYYYEQIKTLYQCGSAGKYNILLFDYQGLGLSNGEISIAAILKDVEAIGMWLTDNAMPTEKIIIYGHGLGAVAACHLVGGFDANFNSPPNLILENPVAKMDYLLSNATQINLPSSFVNQLNFDNIALIKNYKGSLLMILSDQDEKYDKINNGEEIYKAHSGTNKELQVISAQHTNLVPKIGFSEYCTLIDNFID
jgi:hypothetical protein